MNYCTVGFEHRPISLHLANLFVLLHHRHNQPLDRHKWSIGLYAGHVLIGIASCGRPIARRLDFPDTLEVRRLATDGTKNAASMLYGAAWRAAKALGYKRMITYILIEEEGTSLPLMTSTWSAISNPGAKVSIVMLAIVAGFPVMYW